MTVIIKNRLSITAFLVLSFLAKAVGASSDPAFSGIAAKTNDAMSANHNPAGLARIQQSEWTGRVLWAKSESTFDASDDSLGGASTTDDSGDTVVPVLYYARPLTEQRGFGFSFSGTSFSEDYGDGPQRYLAEEYELTSISFVPALGLQLNDQWFAGVGLSVNYTRFEIESAVFNGIGQEDGDFELEADDTYLGFTAGLVYELSPQTRFGARYRSEDKPELSGTPKYKNVDNPPDRRKVTIKNTFPQSLTLGVYHEFADRSWMTTDLILIQFSEFGFTEFQVGDNSIEPREQNFDDTWVITAGYNHRVNPEWILKAGVFYFDQPVSDENRTSTWRLDSIWGVGLGAEYAFSRKQMLAVNLNYMDLGNAPVDAGNGSVVGEFDERYAIILDVSLRWITGGKAIFLLPGMGRIEYSGLFGVAIKLLDLGVMLLIPLRLLTATRDSKSY